MDRITQKQLDSLVEELNVKTGNPTSYGSREADRFKTNVGHYHLYQAYGGVELVQTMNEGGGITVISRNGCTTKRDLYGQIRALLDGISIGLVQGG